MKEAATAPDEATVCAHVRAHVHIHTRVLARYSSLAPPRTVLTLRSRLRCRKSSVEYVEYDL